MMTDPVEMWPDMALSVLWAAMAASALTSWRRLTVATQNLQVLALSLGVLFVECCCYDSAETGLGAMGLACGLQIG